MQIHGAYTCGIQGHLFTVSPPRTLPNDSTSPAAATRSPSKRPPSSPTP